MAKRSTPEDELSSTTERMLDASVEIYGAEPEDRQYLHVVLAQCGLPYRRPKDGIRDYMKQNGRTTLVLTSGHLLDPRTRQPVLQGLPYGAKPRLLMIHLCTQAKLTASPVIDMGNSMSGFMQDLGLSVTGGATGSIGRFKDQLNRLAAARMQLLFDDESKLSMVNSASPISKFDVWFPKDPEQRILWPNTITLGSEFYDSLMGQNALPLDPRAIKGLQQSAMGLDVYTWLAHRLCRIPNNKPVQISWFALRRQFGSEYLEMKHFRSDFKAALARVLTMYRDAKVSFDSNGVLQLRQSRPSVAKTPLKGN